MDEMVPDIDMGDDHFLVFTVWAPDDLPANRATYGIPEWEQMPRVDKFGALIRHYKPDGKLCEGCITFDSFWARQGFSKGPFWTVEQWEPLTLSPSIRCGCGDHGFIRQGKWVRA